MSALLSQVLNTARSFINDDLATSSPDPALIPKVQEAHRELQEQLWLAGSPLVREQTDPILVNAGDTELTLPADILCPFELLENAANAPITDANWKPMTEAFYIPIGTGQGPELIFWAWRKERVQFIGASNSRSVIMRYRRKIPEPVNLNDQIGILFGEMYLSARSAAIFAGSLGNSEVYEKLTALAGQNLASVIQANRGAQRPMMNAA